MPEQCRFRLHELLDPLPVTLGIRLVLVRREKCHASLQCFFQALRQQAVCVLHFACFEFAQHPRQVFSTAPAPGKGREVEGHRGAIQFDGLQQRRFAHRQPAFLVGVAEHEGVRGNRITHQCRGDFACVDKVGLGMANRFGDLRRHVLGLEYRVRVFQQITAFRLLGEGAHKGAGDAFFAVDQRMSNALAQLGQGFGVGTDHQVAA
ncbi:hypothetical protein D3C87_1335920 [compost metagenome]